MKYLLMIGMLVSASQAPLWAKTRPLVAKHIESNEITETHRDGSVRLIKTTVENCEKMHHGLLADIRKLSHFVPAQELAATSWTQKNVIKWDPKDCINQVKRQEMFRFASDMIREHGGKVAVLLPLRYLSNGYVQSLQQGIRAGSYYDDETFNKKFVFIDTGGTAQGTDAAIAKAYFIHNATAIVGGASPLEAQQIAYWSQKILIPVMITRYDENLISKNMRAFSIFPDMDNLYLGVKEAMQQQDIKKVALLYPNSPESVQSIQELAVLLENAGIQISHKASYNPNDYQSMEAAAKRIFEVDQGLRRDEYNQLFRDMKRRAQKAGTPFNPRLVALPPRVHMDAVYISDHFRTVRYMTKIFDYLGVEKIRLFGNQQWRARSLVDPWDPFLDGAYFVDYVGSYATMPKGIQVTATQSPFFLNANEAQHVDYKLIGYLCGFAGSRLLDAKEPSRSQIHRFLLGLDIKEASFFGERKIFQKNRMSNWPYFKFMVSGKNVQLVH